MKKALHNYTKYSVNRAKELRKDMTVFEQKLWYYLRAKRFFGLKFRRQVPIGNYIADFVCKDKMLIIELDGSEHLEDKQLIHDIIRDDYLRSKGYKVIRFYNNDIEKNINLVLQSIKDSIS